MYRVEFYETKDGQCPVWEFLERLREKASTNKDARIQHKQASLYIELLQQNGTRLNDNITKHLEDGIWELRSENNAKNSAPQSVNYCVTDFRRTPVRLQICSLQFALCSTVFFALFSGLAIERSHKKRQNVKLREQKMNEQIIFSERSRIKNEDLG